MLRRLLTAFMASLVLATGLGMGPASGPAHAQDVLPVPPLSGRVIDQTGTLTPAQSQALTTKLAALESQRGSQVVLLLVPTTAPEDIASYAQRVADAWKIGRRDVGDGVVVVVAKNDRKVRIEVSKTLEGAIPDLAAKRIITEQITPAFRAGDFAGGLNAAVDALGVRIAGEGLPVPAPGGPGQEMLEGVGLEGLMIFLFVVVPILGAVLTGMFGRKFGSLLTGGAVGGVGWWLTASVLIAAGAGLAAIFLVGVMGLGASRGGTIGGRGRGAGYSGPVIWGGGGGGGGGWSGGGGGWSSGGGGDFGGGGASGDW
ncbi:MAG: membrane protein [Methylibium sp. NZG]|nr:MAG: membrane protein [Methylibium sp. NZG]